MVALGGGLPGAWRRRARTRPDRGYRAENLQGELELEPRPGQVRPEQPPAALRCGPAPFSAAPAPAPRSTALPVWPRASAPASSCCRPCGLGCSRVLLLLLSVTLSVQFGGNSKRAMWGAATAGCCEGRGRLPEPRRAGAIVQQRRWTRLHRERHCSPTCSMKTHCGQMARGSAPTPCLGMAPSLFPCSVKYCVLANRVSVPAPHSPSQVSKVLPKSSGVFSRRAVVLRAQWPLCSPCFTCRPLLGRRGFVSSLTVPGPGRSCTLQECT